MGQVLHGSATGVALGRVKPNPEEGGGASSGTT